MQPTRRFDLVSILEAFFNLSPSFFFGPPEDPIVRAVNLFSAVHS